MKISPRQSISRVQLKTILAERSQIAAFFAVMKKMAEQTGAAACLIKAKQVDLRDNTFTPPCATKTWDLIKLFTASLPQEPLAVLFAWTVTQRLCKVGG